ncbi:MAG: PRC-barrel domain-containing protein [Candidatus Freyarchaeota archaeon]
MEISIRATTIRGKQIYTTIGNVADVELDFEAGVASGLHVKLKKPVENRNTISIPFSWIKAIGDIIIIKRPQTR